MKSFITLRSRLGGGRTVVVAPAGVEVPDGVLRTLENPPLGGPVAGIAAGLARLAAEPGGPAPRTAVLTCDAPESWRALPPLVRAPRGDPGVSGQCNLARAESIPLSLLASRALSEIGRAHV